MKKKILLLISVMALLSVLLVGCISKPPHKTFSDPWGDYEKITYDVTRGKDDRIDFTGTSTITTERINYADTDKTITVGERVINNFSGTLVTIDTVLSDGSTMFAQIAFKTSFEPVASYKKIDVKGHEGYSPAVDTKQTVELYYNDEKCYYSTDLDGVTSNDEIKVGKWIKKPFYDNLMLYHIARSSYLNGSFTTISNCKIFSVSDLKMKTLTIGLGKDKNNKALLNSPTKLFEGKEDTIIADTVELSLNQTFPGSGKAMKVILSKEKESKDYCGITIPTERIPLKIIEGDITYTIKNYTTNK